MTFLQDVSKYSKGIRVYVKPVLVLNPVQGNSRLLLASYKLYDWWTRVTIWKNHKI